MDRHIKGHLLQSDLKHKGTQPKKVTALGFDMAIALMRQCGTSLVPLVTISLYTNTFPTFYE